MSKGPQELEMISRATTELQLIRYIESCNRLGVPIKEVFNVPKEKIPQEAKTDFLAFMKVRAPETKLRELVAYINAVEDIIELWQSD